MGRVQRPGARLYGMPPGGPPWPPGDGVSPAKKRGPNTGLRGACPRGLVYPVGPPRESRGPPGPGKTRPPGGGLKGDTLEGILGVYPP